MAGKIGSGTSFDKNQIQPLVDAIMSAKQSFEDVKERLGGTKAQVSSYEVFGESEQTERMEETLKTVDATMEIVAEVLSNCMSTVQVVSDELQAQASKVAGMQEDIQSTVSTTQKTVAEANGTNA